jgi:hypothetical protein
MGGNIDFQVATPWPRFGLYISSEWEVRGTFPDENLGTGEDGVQQPVEQ